MHSGTKRENVEDIRQATAFCLVSSYIVDMSKWIHSGRRRDICYILYESGGMTDQELKTELERKYDSRIKPRTFRSAVEKLVETGYVISKTEGLQEHYSLSKKGKQSIEEHLEWIDQETGSV